MSRAVDLKLLNQLDVVIAEHELHASDPLTPVSLARALEAYTTGFRHLPPKVQALTLRWECGGEEIVDISYDVALREPAASASKRHADGHEFAHVACDHVGSDFVMYRRGRGRSSFERHIEKCEERQCDYVAAYLLVPLGALRILRDHGEEYIAALLDVPPKLVKLRHEIWQKFAR